MFSKFYQDFRHSLKLFRNLLTIFWLFFFCYEKFFSNLFPKFFFKIFSYFGYTFFQFAPKFYKIFLEVTQNSRKLSLKILKSLPQLFLNLSKKFSRFSKNSKIISYISFSRNFINAVSKFFYTRTIILNLKFSRVLFKNFFKIFRGFPWSFRMYSGKFYNFFLK